MPLDRCLNFHNPTAGSWDSPSWPLIGQYWPLIWRHRSSKYAQLATLWSFLWYLCLFNSILLGRFVLRDKLLATVNQYILTFFDLPVTSQVKNKVNIIVSCRVRRDFSNAVWIFTLRLLLLKIRRGPFGPPPIRTCNSPDPIRARVKRLIQHLPRRDISAEVVQRKEHGSLMHWPIVWFHTGFFISRTCLFDFSWFTCLPVFLKII